MRCWNEIGLLWQGVLATMWMSHLGTGVVNAISISIPFETSVQLRQAVDVYLSAELDDEAVLEIVTKHGVMETWDVSRITDFSDLFSRSRNPDAKQFQADLSQWDVSQSDTFANMFRGAQSVDFDVSAWDVTIARDFSRMFDSATDFQGQGLALWNVSAGLDFTEMFRGATSFGINAENSICAWLDLMSPSAVTDDMFLESQCPIELGSGDFPVAPALRASLGAGSSKTVNFCHPCPEPSSIENPDGKNVSDSNVPNDEPAATEDNTKSDDEKRPNVLFIMTDQQRFDTIRFVQDELSYYDNNLKIDTPNLDKLLKEGAYFRNAYCQCAVCAPARATLRTGCTIERTGVQHNDMAKDYEDGDIFQERVESVESLDQILVEKYGYTSEYYGKWHMPDKLYESKFNGSPEPVVKFNDFDFVGDEFEFIGDDSSHKVRRYLDQYEKLGVISKVQKKLNSTAVTSGILPTLSKGNPQIDTYTRYPYIPVQLDTRYNSPIGTDLNGGGFDSFARSQPNIIGIHSLKEEEGSPTHFTGDVAVRALHRLKESTNPWLLTISFHHPHPPFVAPYSSYLDKYWTNKELLHVPESLNDNMDNSAYTVITDKLPGYKDPEKIQEWTAIYYALIEEVDFKIGEILSALGSAADDTLIIFTSDHGEMLGAHGKRSKNNFYEESSKIPLLIKFPGYIEPGTELNEVVSHIDLFSTILDYVGAGEDDNSDGKSLRSFIEGTEYNRDYDEGNVVFAEWDFRAPTFPGSNEMDRHIDERPSFLVRKANYKLMMQKLALSNEMDMMFDLAEDPFEMNNLLGKNAMSADTEIIHKAEHMRCLLLEWMERLDGEKKYFSDPEANYGDGNGDIVEIRERQRWKQVGFWISDEILEFGKMTKWKNGIFVRHEHLYFGTRADETISVSSVEISGPNAAWFSLDQDSITFGYKECRSIRITLKSPQDLPKGSRLDATVTIEVESSMTSKKSVHEIRLALSEEVYGEPSSDENEQRLQNLGEGDYGHDTNTSATISSPSGPTSRDVPLPSNSSSCTAPPWSVPPFMALFLLIMVTF